MTDISSLLVSPLRTVLEPQERLWWNYIAMSYAIAGVIVWIVRRETRSLSETLGYLFPGTVWKQRGVIHDVSFSYVTLVFQYAVLGLLISKLSNTVANDCLLLLRRLIPDLIPLSLSETTLVLLTTIVLTLALDFGLFLAHWLLHKVPFLWPFHAVHHSAESLTPFTGYRQHPLDTLFNALVTGSLMGSVLGILRFSLGDQIHFIGVGGQTVFILLFYLFGYHLRHSHIWVSYGTRWSKILISPAQHQIHHSLATQHHDKNFGYMLAIWDGLFRTLYIPKNRESLTFGLQDSFLGQKPTFTGLLLLPFSEVLRHHRPTLVFLIITALLFLEIHSPLQPTSTTAATTATVELAKLTSDEVADRLSQGWRTIIIPTGGTEQNGPHMILGKHNEIVMWNAIEIAHRIGNTLVAPVMAYVPEGDIESREGHMAFPGTLSLRSETFQSLLRDTAMSLKAHGFRRILLLGDSGGNQKDQELVAISLEEQWRQEGVDVIALSGYYLNNHQKDYLASLGLSLNQIGHHGGIRDTSELMFVAPQGIRNSLLSDRTHQSLTAESGSDGNTLLATPLLGQTLIELKISAAMAEIRSRSQPPASISSLHAEQDSLSGTSP
jgi:sterol desaturase/sphingolipid hydroxylase (fatty acid hydroxylase superfamily)/creatinine amidohydrolase/Fe(II)-dependent formamide hydrolase-like protein